MLLFVIIAGPALKILKAFFTNTAAYIQNPPQLSDWIGREGADRKFLPGWTTFYWARWISRPPFVDMFVARVSRGRTVREFLICVLIIPSIVGIIWLTSFGGAAISRVVNRGYQGVVGTPSCLAAVLLRCRRRRYRPDHPLRLYCCR